MNQVDWKEVRLAAAYAHAWVEAATFTVPTQQPSVYRDLDLVLDEKEHYSMQDGHLYVVQEGRVYSAAITGAKLPDVIGRVQVQISDGYLGQVWPRAAWLSFNPAGSPIGDIIVGLSPILAFALPPLVGKDGVIYDQVFVNSYAPFRSAPIRYLGKLV